MMSLKKEELSLVNSFEFERKLLRTMRFYPVIDNKFKNRTLYFVHGFIVTAVAVGQFLSMLVQVVMDITDLLKLSDSLFFFITHCTYMGKLITFVYYNKKFVVIEDSLKQPIFQKFPEDRLNILKTKIDSANNLATAFRLMVAVVVCSYGIMPFLDRSKMILPLPGWQPYNATASLYYYYPTIAFQICSVSYTAVNNLNVDCIAWMLFNLISAQFEVLKKNLKSIDYGKGGAEKFKRCVLHYEAIVELTYKTEAIFSKGMFMMFLASLVVICFTGFTMILVPVMSFQFCFLTIYLACMIGDVGLYCWYGHNVILTSDEIQESFYMSNWYLADIPLRKNFVIFLERTKKPVTVTAGKMVVLSLSTFSGILRSSYSYFAVLQQVS